MLSISQISAIWKFLEQHLSRLEPKLENINLEVPKYAEIKIKSINWILTKLDIYRVNRRYFTYFLGL